MDTLADLGRASVEWLWVPTAVWTVAAGFVLLALRYVPARVPLLRYRLRQALLFSLPAALLLAPITPGLVPAESVTAIGSSVLVPATVSSDTEQTPPPRDLRAPTIDGASLGAGVAVVLAICLALIQLSHLMLRFTRLRALSRTATRATDPAALGIVGELSARLGLRRAPTLLIGPADSVPMTFGWRSPVVVVPRGLLERTQEFRLAVHHELVHVARSDFAWACAERLVCAVLAFHPLLWALSRGADRDRESSCDAEVLTSGDVRLDDYANLLFSLAQSPRPHLGLAAGLTVPASQLKERIETMKDFTTQSTTPRARRGSHLAALALLLMTTTVAACLNVSGTAVSRDDAELATTQDLLAQAEESASANLTAAINTLEAQLAYLDGELETVLEDHADRVVARQNGEEVSEWPRQEIARYTLLGEMYEERLRDYENLMMEAIAEEVRGR